MEPRWTAPAQVKASGQTVGGPSPPSSTPSPFYPAPWKRAARRSIMLCGQTKALQQLDPGDQTEHLTLDLWHSKTSGGTLPFIPPCQRPCLLWDCGCDEALSLPEAKRPHQSHMTEHHISGILPTPWFSRWIFRSSQTCFIHLKKTTSRMISNENNELLGMICNRNPEQNLTLKFYLTICDPASVPYIQYIGQCPSIEE